MLSPLIRESGTSTTRLWYLLLVVAESLTPRDKVCSPYGICNSSATGGDYCFDIIASARCRVGLSLLSLLVNYFLLILLGV